MEGPWPRICCYWSGFSAATVNVLRTAQVLARLHNWRPCSVRPRHVVWPGLFSLWEGLPNVALEASASGLPAILSHAANLDGIVAPGETGWEVPTGRQAPLVEALAEALAASPERWRAMGKAGRDRVSDLFKPERVLSETLATYDALLAEATPCAA